VTPDIIAAIDAVTDCQQCGGDLSVSVSIDFCKEECQQVWQAARVGEVPDGDNVPDLEMLRAWGVSAEAAAFAMRQFGMSIGPLMEHVSTLTRRP
jgi:hypothetical protein